MTSLACGSGSGSWTLADGLGTRVGRGVGALAQKSICVAIGRKARSLCPDGPAISLPESCVSACFCPSFVACVSGGPAERDPSLTRSQQGGKAVAGGQPERADDFELQLPLPPSCARCWQPDVEDQPSQRPQLLPELGRRPGPEGRDFPLRMPLGSPAQWTALTEGLRTLDHP